MAKRKCTGCNREKERHLWLAKEYNKRGPALCKSCYKRSPAYRKELNRNYMKKFGITLDEYDALLREQDGTCFICCKYPRSKRLAVDHDHALEAEGMRESVRGLLCRDCNEYLGHIGDNPVSALLMRRYLTRPTAVERGVLN